MDFIEKLELPRLCNYVMEATDAVQVLVSSILKVKYKDLEMARINGWTHLNRIHRAPHDSAQNEAERSSAAIGEALVDGGVVKWEYYKATYGLNQEQIKHREDPES